MARTVLVTGATGAVGAAAVKAFEGAGYRVVAAARHAALAVDLTTREGVTQCLEAAGEVDVLAHVMGGFEMGDGEEIWQRMLDLNLRPATRLFASLAPLMKARGFGRLIAIGSKAGETRPAGLTAYSASKAALHALVQTTAAELRGTGVTSNALLPTTVDTPAMRETLPNAKHAQWVTPEEIAALMVHLASDAAAHINGALIPMGD